MSQHRRWLPPVGDGGSDEIVREDSKRSVNHSKSRTNLKAFGCLLRVSIPSGGKTVESREIKKIASPVQSGTRYHDTVPGNKKTVKTRQTDSIAVLWSLDILDMEQDGIA